MRVIASRRLVAIALPTASLVRSLAAIVAPIVGAAMFPWGTFCASRVDFVWWMMLLLLSALQTDRRIGSRDEVLASQIVCCSLKSRSIVTDALVDHYSARKSLCLSES